MTNVPPGFTQCKVCGEFNGTTDKKNLSGWPGDKSPIGQISVICLCQVIPCRRFKKYLINRPTSNSYDPKDNCVWHWPNFSALMGCNHSPAISATAFIQRSQP